MKLRENKKGVELSLETIIVFIIVLIVLIVLIVFFVDKFGGGSTEFFKFGNSAIDSAKDS